MWCRCGAGVVLVCCRCGVGVIVGIGFLVGQPVVVIVGIVVGALGFVLKEKGVL